MTIRLGVTCSVLICGFAALASCSSKDKGGTFVAPDTGGAGGSGGRVVGAGGKGGRGGSSGTAASDGGEGGMPDQNSALAPVVEITSPMAVTNPDNGKVLADSQVTVTCSVTQSPKAGAQAVLSSSVKIQMFGADGKQIGVDGIVMSTGSVNEYSSMFALTKIPSGPLSFVCSATDKSIAANSGSATLNTFFDGGPTIALSEPADKSARALGATQFKFSALPTSLATGDKGSAVNAVTLKVNGVAIPGFVETVPGYYSISLDLNNTKIFATTPAGTVPVVITATNKRGTTATSNFSFTVDSMGPVIKIISPQTANVQFVGGQVTLQFSVTDEPGGSQVDPDKVTVQLNTNPAVTYKEGDYWHMLSDGKTFDYSFNTLDYPSQLQVSVEVNAYDKAGNKAQGATASYYLDNRPPIIDMQPPSIQEESGTIPNNRCSAVFDPLGDSPNDLNTIPSVRFYRALLWDVGNLVDGQGISFFSDIDTDVGVRLYFQEDISKPLLKNKQNVDGAVCNEIADPTLPFVNLVPIAPAGYAFFPADAPPVPSSTCKPGTEMTPAFLCNGNSSLTRVIQHETATAGTNSAVIYAVQGDMGALCTGGQLDITTKVTKDGWVCAAVVAQDKIGNRSVSSPLRLCLDAADSAGVKYQGAPGCVSGLNPPTCVAPGPKGCIPPPHFQQTLIKRP